MRRAEKLASQGLDFIDVGTSGGIWGLANGFCLMVGGPDAAVKRLEPAFRTLAPTEVTGYSHLGPSGAGHYVKMVHNAIEYALMEAYAEGFELLSAKEEFDLDLAAIAETWRHGAVVRSWLLDLAAAALSEDPGLESLQAFVEDSGEGSLDCPGVRRPSRANPCDYRCSPAALPLPAGRSPRRQAPRCLAPAVRRPRRAPYRRIDWLQALLGLWESITHSPFSLGGDGWGEGMTEQTTTIVIFGASGDLASNKLAPALADLYSKGRLGQEVHIVGVSRTDMTADEFRASFYKGFGQGPRLSPAPDLWNDFADRIHSCYGDVTAPDGLRDLERTLANIESPDRPGNRLYYLALAPFLFAPAVEALGKAGYYRENDCWRRVVVEKPFGVNLETAVELNRVVHSVFAEHQVYRIDHYLGKETVQNLLVFSLRQRHIRAHLVPQLYRQHPDNRGRVRLHRRTCSLLRPRRRPPRYVPEPHIAAPRRGCNGAALHLRG